MKVVNRNQKTPTKINDAIQQAQNRLIGNFIPDESTNNIGTAAAPWAGMQLASGANTNYGGGAVTFTGGVSYSFDQPLGAASGGSNNGFFQVTGPATSAKTFTLPNASATILTNNAAVTIAQGGTGQTTANPAFNALSPLTTEGDLLYYTSSANARLAGGTAGQWLQWNGTDPLWANQWQIVEQTSNFSVTSNASLANTSLTFAVAASTKYRFRIFAFITCGTTGGWAVQLTGPASPTAILTMIRGTDSAGNSLASSVNSFALTNQNEASVSGATIEILGLLQNGTNAGSVTLQFAQKVSNGTASVLAAPSWLEWSAA